jgi:glycosyltransferase involved in cell wall biosynthesis
MDPISIVIPVFNSEQTLEQLHERIVGVASLRGVEFEIILVNDGSTDRSWDVIESIAALDGRVRGFNLMRNYGQHNALLCGVRAAKNPIIVTMDDDLQHPPEELPILLDALTVDVDVVYGVPESEQHGLLRDLASVITKKALQASMGADVARLVSAFRVFRTSLRQAFGVYQGTFISLDVLLTWGTTRFVARTVRHDARRVGVSNYTLRRLLTHALNMVTGYSTVPLQIASVVGFAFTLFGMAVLIWVLVVVMVNGSSVPGFAFLASIISLFSGAMLFALGIMGEYLARMHFRLMERPTYAVRSTANGTMRAVSSGQTSSSHERVN